MMDSEKITDYGVEINDNLVSRLADLYVADFVPPNIRESDPVFYSRRRFFERMEDYKSSPKFSTTVVTIDDNIIAFASVANLIPNTAWWRNVEYTKDVDTAEDNDRTVAIFDLLVIASYRGQGVARRLHSHLLNTRQEERFTLLCSRPQVPAYQMWQSWGYEVVGSKADVPDQQLSVFLRQK